MYYIPELIDRWFLKVGKVSFDSQNIKLLFPVARKKPRLLGVALKTIQYYFQKFFASFHIILPAASLMIKYIV